MILVAEMLGASLSAAKGDAVLLAYLGAMIQSKQIADSHSPDSD
jgi:hypothetical protein